MARTNALHGSAGKGMSMRILHVMAGAAHGGAETACIDMVLAMHEAGQKVGLVSRTNPRNECLTAAGIPVFTLPFGGVLDIYTPWAMRRIIRRFGPDIVQTWMSRAANKTPRWTPSVGVERYQVVSRLGGYYSLKYFKSTDYFTTITPLIREWLIGQGVPADRVVHINNFAEVENASIPASRDEAGIPHGAPLLLGLGRLHTSKAFDTLIKAAAEVPDVYVWIAGEGPERRALEALISSMGLEDRVKLLGWRSDRAALFKSSDACVFCSRYEPFGTVFVQSWAQEVPVIVTDADGPRQFVRDGEDGLVVPKDDVTALSAAIRRLLADKALQSRMVANGLARYQSEFTKEAAVGGYLSLYRSITSGHGGKQDEAAGCAPAAAGN